MQNDLWDQPSFFHIHGSSGTIFLFAFRPQIWGLENWRDKNEKKSKEKGIPFVW